MNTERIDVDAALTHFKKNDKVMYGLLKRALSHNDPIELPAKRTPSKYFESTVSSIVSQQISTKAAASVYARVKACLSTITPESVNNTKEEDLRACGLSRQKADYIKYNAKVWHTVPINTFKKLDDEDVIQELIKLHGIGRWTAEMFLMFTLARPDVFSKGDLGLMQGLFQEYPVQKHHVKKIDGIITSWSPHRTLASLALWHVKDNEPVVL